MPPPDRTEDAQPLPLEKAVSYLLEECRIVLPGIQVLFGFQLIAVFSERFSTALSAREQHLHLLAIALVAIAVALIMAPAACHRQCQPQQVSQSLMRVSTALLLASLPPLAMAISIDVFLVARLVTGPGGLATALAVGLLAVFGLLWFALPQWMRWRSRR